MESTSPLPDAITNDSPEKAKTSPSGERKKKPRKTRNSKASKKVSKRKSKKKSKSKLEPNKHILTLSFKIRHPKKSIFEKAAREANQVFNWANQTSYEAVRRSRRTYLSEFDLKGLATGCTQSSDNPDGFQHIAMGTVHRVITEVVARKQQFKKAKLRFRRSGGKRKSPAWIPFKKENLDIWIRGNRFGERNDHGMPKEEVDSFFEACQIYLDTHKIKPSLRHIVDFRYRQWKVVEAIREEELLHAMHNKESAEDFFESVDAKPRPFVDGSLSDGSSSMGSGSRDGKTGLSDSENTSFTRGFVPDTDFLNDESLSLDECIKRTRALLSERRKAVQKLGVQLGKSSEKEGLFPSGHVKPHVGIRVLGQPVDIFNPETLVFWLECMGGEIRSGQITEDTCGDWYLQVSIAVDRSCDFRWRRCFMQGWSKIAKHEIVGIDPGVKTFLTCVNEKDQVYEIPGVKAYQEAEEKLAMLQRRRHNQPHKSLSRKVKRRRQHAIQQVALDLVKNHQIIKLGNLSSKLLAKSHSAKKAADQSLGRLRQALGHLAEDSGRMFVDIDESYTTQTCPSCKARTGPKGRRALCVRQWVCSQCGAHHERDVAAAINIRDLPMDKAVNVIGGLHEDLLSRQRVAARFREHPHA